MSALVALVTHCTYYMAAFRQDRSLAMPDAPTPNAPTCENRAGTIRFHLSSESCAWLYSLSAREYDQVHDLLEIPTSFKLVSANGFNLTSEKQCLGRGPACSPG